MTQTVLVTGVGGFVGGHVVEELLAQTNWRVVGIDSFRHNGHFANLVDATDVASTTQDRVVALVHDLTTPFTARQCDRLNDVDYVVNVASRSSVDESIDDPTTFVRNNVELMLSVLELCRVVRPRRLIHMSTDEVYGPWGGRVTTDHRPSSPYAASKAAQVDLACAYARTYGIPTTIVTSANMFGERQSQLAFIPRVINAVLDDTELTVHCHNGLPGERTYTYVRNVVTRIIDELLVDVDDVTRHVVLPGQHRIANDDLAHTVARIIGQPLRYRVVDATDVRPGYDPTYADLDATWTPEIDFITGLQRTIAWTSDQRRSDHDVRRPT